MAIASHPISFKLLDDHGNSILTIFDGRTQPAKLGIENTSRRDWSLKKLPLENASSENHHFELKFRPGTLKLSGTTPITVDAGNEGWKISGPTETSDGVSFYLLSTKPGTVKQGTSTFVKLNNLSAEPGSGARGTRVELKWARNRMEYVADSSTDAESLFEGHRVQHLSIVNGSGDQLPMFVGIEGTARLLSDGQTPNTLKLRMQPTSGRLQLYPRGRFIISFATSDVWALSTSAEVTFIALLVKMKENNQKDVKQLVVIKQEGRISPTWEVAVPQQMTLETNEYIEITLAGILSPTTPGTSNLYIHYKNIDGYRDGDFVVAVERGPLVYRGDNVGIGTSKPEAKLHVAGNVRMGIGNELFFEERGTIRNKDNTSLLSFNTYMGKAELRSYAWIVFSSGATDGGETAKVVIDGSGRMGIGTGTTNNPKSKLQVKEGDVRLDPNRKILFDDNDIVKNSIGRDGTNLELRDSGKILFSPGATTTTASAVKALVTEDGRFGIGALEPEKHLHVKGTADQEIMIESTDEGGQKWTLQSSQGGASGRFEIINRSAGKSCLTILKGGNVGIGNVDPTHGKLEVSGLGSPQVHNFGFLDSSGKAGTSNLLSVSYSIWAGNNVAGAAFHAFSDERIKDVVGRSDGATDLHTLLSLEVTNYKHKDVVSRGDRTHKKFLAQQVERVYPESVSKVKDVVPDVYRRATHAGGWIELATDLKKGERVRLISDAGVGVHEVREVLPDRFRVELNHEADSVFVYGREVNDYRLLDYDAITALNVSATQQLKKELDHEVKTLRAENDELKSANDALAKRLQLLESRMESAFSFASVGKGSNGNGQH